jgi:O-methyltransferase involved in polyketide biosynthesis
MKDGDPSRTAIVTAIVRAAHYLLDAEPKILNDRFAHVFAGFPSDEELLKTLNTLAFPDFPRMRTLFTLRNRYAEDELVRTIEMRRLAVYYSRRGVGFVRVSASRPSADP